MQKVKDQEIDSLNKQISQINSEWTKMKTSLEQRFKYCEQLHRKHQSEVKDYLTFAEDLDASKLTKKIQRITFQLQTDCRDVKMSVEQMRAERDQLKIFIERAKKELATETLRNRQMVDILASAEESSNQNQALREQIQTMRAEMTRINNYSIDMSNNPAQAIQKISDPILQLLNLKIDDFQ